MSKLLPITPKTTFAVGASLVWRSDDGKMEATVRVASFDPSGETFTVYSAPLLEVLPLDRPLDFTISFSMYGYPPPRSRVGGRLYIRT